MPAITLRNAEGEAKSSLTQSLHEVLCIQASVKDALEGPRIIVSHCAFQISQVVYEKDGLCTDPWDWKPATLVMIEMAHMQPQFRRSQRTPTLLHAYPIECPNDMRRGSPAGHDEISSHCCAQKPSTTYDQLDARL